MSARANPMMVGLFMIGALLLIVVGVFVLVGNTWFQDKETFASYFPQSVNGLVVGAPVKFQGAPVGEVTKLLIQIDPNDTARVMPVEYEIDVKQLRTAGGRGYLDLSEPDVLERQVTDGLRAQLQMESILTGQLYIELTYRKDAKPPVRTQANAKWPEIPTTPSLLAALGSGAGSLIAEVMKGVNRVNDMLASIDIKEINNSLVSSARSIQRVADAPGLRKAMDELPALTSQITRTMARIDTVTLQAGAAIEPMSADLRGATRELNATMLSLRKSIDQTQGLLSTDSQIGFGLEAALLNLRDASNALRQLMISLDQNPDMLLRGKRPPVKK